MYSINVSLGFNSNLPSLTSHIAHHFSVLIATSSVWVPITSLLNCNTLLTVFPTPGSSRRHALITGRALRSVRGFVEQKPGAEVQVVGTPVWVTGPFSCPRERRGTPMSLNSRARGLRTQGCRCTAPFRPRWQESPEGPKVARSRRIAREMLLQQPGTFSLLPSFRAVPSP